MPSRAGLIRSRPAHIGAYVVGVAISEVIFRSREARPTKLGSVLKISREQAVATRWEVHRINEDRLEGVAKLLLAGSDRPVPRLRRSIPLRLPRLRGRA
jgi:hypothetical protein